MMDNNVHFYEMTVTAAGEVRDVDGNLISAGPVTATAVVTAEQAARLLASADEGEAL